MLNAPFQDASNEDLGLKAENIWAFPTNVSSSSFKDYLSTDAETALNADIPLLFVAFPSAKDPKWSSYPGGKRYLTLIWIIPILIYDRLFYLNFWSVVRSVKLSMRRTNPFHSIFILHRRTLFVNSKLDPKMFRISPKIGEIFFLLIWTSIYKICLMEFRVRGFWSL